MIYCFNPDVCRKENVRLKTFLFALSLYLDEYIGPNVFEEMCVKGFIEYDGFDLMGQPVNPKLTQSGVNMVENILLSSEFNKEDKASKVRLDFESIAEKMQYEFPDKKKPGTIHHWRGSKAMVAKKLQAIVKKYGVIFTEEEAVDAARRYVASFGSDQTFMQVLEYFISKRDSKTGEERSQFLSYLENKDMQETHSNDELI